MRVIVIGGSGHIGTYLTPRLVEAGHSVTCVSRSQREPYVAHAAWREVERRTLDRGAESFGRSIVELRPDAVIDLISYTVESTQHLVVALQGSVGQFLHCGTVWVHGPGIEVPVTEDQPRRPISDYGRRKAAIEDYLLSQYRSAGFPAAILHPGHLVGTGWTPLNPAANFNPKVFIDLANGDEILLPNIGRETLHHVHADDVAQAFAKAVERRPAAVGNSFHICSPAALSMIGYAESVAGLVRTRGPRALSALGRVAGGRFRKGTRTSRGTTLRAPRITASKRRGGFWGMNRATTRWMPFGSRSRA